MKTVKEVSVLTGVSIRTLHHYHAIGLLPPDQVTEAGYRLYDESSVERLYLIMLYREMGFSLKEIRALLDASDTDRHHLLEQQICILEQQRQRLQDRISLARGMQKTGVKFMDFSNLNTKKVDDYSAQAETMWGNTSAYQEYREKSRGRTDREQRELGQDMMALFAKVGHMRDAGPDSPAVQEWVKELQAFITAHYYTCTTPILRGLGEMYAGGGSMTENIDKAGGAGTGAFAQQAIRIYCDKNG